MQTTSIPSILYPTSLESLPASVFIFSFFISKRSFLLLTWRTWEGEWNVQTESLAFQFANTTKSNQF